MTKTKLFDGTEVYCLRKPEAKMLDHHVEGYLQNGIDIKDGDVVFDVGANIDLLIAAGSIKKATQVRQAPEVSQAPKVSEFKSTNYEGDK